MATSSLPHPNRFLRLPSTDLDRLKLHYDMTAIITPCFNGSYLEILMDPDRCQRAGERPCSAESTTELII